jgi:hypothetical protein
MPGTASATFYDLAIRALEAQEREVNSLRTRTGTLAAAAAVAGTVLAREVFTGVHPDGWFAWTVTVTGLFGLGIVLVASVYLLRSHSLAFSIDSTATFADAMSSGAVDADNPADVQIGVAIRLSTIRADNGPVVNRLRLAFAVALAGLVVEIVGLGIGAALP